MSDFRTSIPKKKSEIEINHKSKLFFIGSCFSSNIYEQVDTLKFSAFSNPYGVLFNPISIAQALHEILDKKVYVLQDLIYHNDLYHSFQHHSSFSSVKPEETLRKINQRIEAAHHFIQNTHYILITLGTAWVYKYQYRDIVANCHKIPNKEFGKVLLSVDKITSELQRILHRFREHNKELKIVFTVSPVRHLKDGFEENTLSKSILRNAIYQLQQENSFVSYFPAYEIMMDDLRDYRFYNEDMLHPNSVAIRYIFQQFSLRYFNEETLALNKRIEKLNAASKHRFFNENTAATEKHKAFVAAEKEAIENMLKNIRLG